MSPGENKESRLRKNHQLNGLLIQNSTKELVVFLRFISVRSESYFGQGVEDLPLRIPLIFQLIIEFLPGVGFIVEV